jgi:hypothetical protein
VTKAVDRAWEKVYNHAILDMRSDREMNLHQRRIGWTAEVVGGYRPAKVWRLTPLWAARVADRRSRVYGLQ